MTRADRSDSDHDEASGASASSQAMGSSTAPVVTALIEQRAGAFEVGPAPMGTLHQRIRRAKRRRNLGMVAAGVAATVAVVGGVVVREIATDSGSTTIADSGATPDATPETPTPDPTPAPGQRLVAVGGVSIAVPAEWSTDDTRCGTALSNTVILTPSLNACGTFMPADTTSVTLTLSEGRSAPSEPPLGSVPVTVDGLGFDRIDRCAPQVIEGFGPPGDAGSATMCTTSLLPIESGTAITVQSTIAPERTALTFIDSLIGSMTALNGAIGVPPIPAPSDQGAVEEYVGVLRGLGLSPEVAVRDDPAALSGQYLGSDPAVGETVDLGDPVTVFVAR